MKRLIHIIVLALLVGCSQSTMTVIVSEECSSNPKVDKFDRIDLVSATDTISLFRIAQEGNLEYLGDTLLVDSLGKMSHVITIADFFQESQLFYVVYDNQTGKLYETERIYLPKWGVECFDSVNAVLYSDSLLFIQIKKNGDSILPQKLYPIKYNEDKVINYYEYESSYINHGN